MEKQCYQTGYGEYFLVGGANGNSDNDIAKMVYRSFDGNINTSISITKNKEGLTEEQKRAFDFLCELYTKK